MEMSTLRIDSIRFEAIEHHEVPVKGRVMEKEEIRDFLFMVSGANLPDDEKTGTFDDKA